jgi:aryl-alcohol dehydrogenase-like predicted oxidoreductase
MLYRELGTTGMQVSAIGMGTWNIGNQWGQIDASTAVATVRSAYDHGVNLFDTAESYGIPAGLCEERLGAALTGIRDRVHLVTKIGRWGRRTGQTVPMTSIDMIRLCTHASLFRLQTNCIDVMLCHEGKIEDPYVYLAGFEQLKTEGYIRTYGISTDSLEVLKRFNVNGTCGVVEVDYSLLNRSPEKEFFPYCQEHGIGVLARGPLHKGLLSGKYSPDTRFTDTVRSEWYDSDRAHEKLNRNLAKVEQLKTVLQPGAEMVSAALGFVISHPVQPVAIPGAKSPEQAQANAEAGKALLSAEDCQRLTRLTKVPSNDASEPVVPALAS